MRLELFAVSGRRVAHIADGNFAAGAHTVDRSGFGEGGERIAAGVFFLRFTAQGERRRERVGLIP